MKKFIETLKNIWHVEDLRIRLLITILFIAIYRFGSFVVLPGIHGAGPRYMFDYYAVIKDMRGMGVGSHFIKKLLAEDLGDGSLVLLEIEDPDCARSPEDREICERRRSFYINNGLIDTGVHVNTFGVEFVLMEAPAFGKHTKCEVREYYADFYRAFLPPLIFRKMILIREA